MRFSLSADFSLLYANKCAVANSFSICLSLALFFLMLIFLCHSLFFFVGKRRISHFVILAVTCVQYIGVIYCPLLFRLCERLGSIIFVCESFAVFSHSFVAGRLTFFSSLEQRKSYFKFELFHYLTNQFHASSFFFFVRRLFFLKARTKFVVYAPIFTLSKYNVRTASQVLFIVDIVCLCVTLLALYFRLLSSVLLLFLLVFIFFLILFFHHLVVEFVFTGLYFHSTLVLLFYIENTLFATVCLSFPSQFFFFSFFN